MARQYSIAEARAQLSAIIDQASAGREVVLTRRGRPVAVILPTQELERLRGRQTGFPTAYERFIGKFPAKGDGIGKDFARSLRDRSPGRDVAL